MTAARALPSSHSRLSDDRDAVIHACALMTPYDAARLLGLDLAPGSSPRSSWVRTLCLWHSERNHSCHITIKRGVLLAHCQSCKSGGNAIDIVAAKEGRTTKGTDFAHVLKVAASILGVELSSDRPDAGPRPVTPLDAERGMRREAQQATQRAEAALKAAREEHALAVAELLARIDGLEATVAGLSDALVAMRNRSASAGVLK